MSRSVKKGPYVHPSLLEKVGRLNAAKLQAEEIVREELLTPAPEDRATETDDEVEDSQAALTVELLQDFEFEEASQCVRISEDGEWVVSTGMLQQ